MSNHIFLRFFSQARRLSLVLVFLSVIGPLHAQDLDCRWLPGFYSQGVNGVVHATAIFDDGNGPALYVGGNFTSVDNLAVSYLAKWDGESWSTVGGGVDGTVFSLAVHQDANGKALYVGGDFATAGSTAAQRIAKWTGAAWQSISTSLNGPPRIMLGSSDGSEPLYIGGSFTFVDGSSTRFIAQYDGTKWSPVGNDTNGTVLALTRYDDGNGSALYIGGSFSEAGAEGAHHIAKLDGGSWKPLGTGMDQVIRTLIVHDDGSGNALYAGGDFTTAGGIATNRIAKWNGTAWSAVGDGTNDEIYTLAAYNDGSGSALYAGGDFTTAGGVALSRLAKWNGSSWSAASGGPAISGMDDTVRTLNVFTAPGGSPALFAGGDFATLNGENTGNFVRLEGTSWNLPTTAPPGNGLNGIVRAFKAWHQPGNSQLYAGGFFTTAGNQEVNYIAAWDGTSWSPLGSGMNAQVYALEVFDDGTGPALYAAGFFTEAGGVAANHIAKWDGMTWEAVGGGTDDIVLALGLFDDGTGTALYAGGHFASAGGVAANNIAKWDGTTWTPLGPGLGDFGSVYTLQNYDDGGGTDLYAGGSFQNIEGNQIRAIAEWNGTAWTALQDNTGGPIWALETYRGEEEGSMEELYLGGNFSFIGPQVANNLARWDGLDWNAAGSGFNTTVYALREYKAGQGLFAGGFFTSLGNGTPIARIARWFDERWWILPTGGTTGTVRTMEVFNKGDGSVLYVGGEFLAAGGLASTYIAAYDCSPLFSDGFESGDASAWPGSVP